MKSSFNIDLKYKGEQLSLFNEFNEFNDFDGTIIGEDSSIFNIF
jgi:hypothetical protein